jgi:hypothetical protein
MSNPDYTDYEDIAPGRVEIQSMARRQLTASVIVALVIAAASGLMALRPASRVAADVAAPHKVAVILHPSPAAPRVAAARNSVELP